MRTGRSTGTPARSAARPNERYVHIHSRGRRCFDSQFFLVDWCWNGFDFLGDRTKLQVCKASPASALVMYLKSPSVTGRKNGEPRARSPAMGLNTGTYLNSHLKLSWTSYFLSEPSKSANWESRLDYGEFPFQDTVQPSFVCVACRCC